jgi:hypothetical protein
MLTKRNILFFIAACLLGSLLFFYYKYVYKPTVNWSETYYEDNQEPYGSSIIYSLLDGISGGKGIIKINNPASLFFERNKPSAHANYVFIGNNMSLSQTDADSLFNFVKRGNSVFISTNYLPANIDRRIFYDFVDDVNESNEDYSNDIEIDSLSTKSIEPEDSSKVLDSVSSVIDTNFQTEIKSYYDIQKIIEDSVVLFHFRHSALGNHSRKYRFQYLNEFKPKLREWNYINDTCAVDSGISKVLLGYLEPNYPVFYKYKIGKGELFFHTVPITLTNLYVRQRAGFEYANHVFTHLKPGVVYWDNYHSVYRSNYSNGNNESSPLKYILSQPALKWAWYLGLVGLILYFIFYAKRKQRIIPLRMRIENTSIEFVQTLAQLFKNGNDKKIVEIKEKNWRIFIWERYKIHPDLPMEEYTHMVSKYSGLPEENIKLIIGLTIYLKKSPFIPSKDLFEYQQNMERFYNQCK